MGSGKHVEGATTPLRGGSRRGEGKEGRSCFLALRGMRSPLQGDAPASPDSE